VQCSVYSIRRLRAQGLLCGVQASRGVWNVTNVTFNMVLLSGALQQLF
jgi:hypothetical protein